MRKLLVRCVKFQQLENVDARNSYVDKLGPVTVERAALRYYNSLGKLGLWTENYYWWYIMALLFWQIIFARIRGVYSPLLGKFPGRFQDIPNDFFSRNFYSKRFTMIERRMEELRGCASISEVLTHTYSAHRGEPCRPIEDWNRYSIDELEKGAQSLMRDQLLMIMNRLLTNFGGYRSGLPDLFFFEPSPMFVEVKSESDSVRTNQLDWFQFLSEDVGVDVELLLVNHRKSKLESTRTLLETKGFNIHIVEDPIG